MIHAVTRFLALLATGISAAEWDYAAYGADWDGVCASGARQSPIDLDTADTEPLMFGIGFSESGTPDTGYVQNNGHTMVYVPNTVGAVTITNPRDGDAEYTLAQFHCHWDDSAETTNLGSEHTLDGAPYPLECHFVHYRTSYGSLGAAVGESDGLMVVGQFYEIDNESSNSELDKFLDAAVEVVSKGAVFNLTEDLAITPFVTTNPDVYTYKGSLTTPTCNEVVEWFVYRTPMGVRTSQLRKLWALERDGSSNTIEHNWRPTQPLRARTVYRNFALGSYGAGSWDFYTCSNLPQYWLDKAADYDVDPCRIGFNTSEGQWYIDEEPACVAWGEASVQCNHEYFCAGLNGAVVGYGDEQMATLARMIAGDFHTHSLCPVCPPAVGPGYVDSCRDGEVQSSPIGEATPSDFGMPGSIAMEGRGTWLTCDCDEIHIGHNVPADAYWYNQAEAQGLDGDLVTHYHGVWYYDGKYSCVAMGLHADSCDGRTYHCAGSDGGTFGYGSQQMAALKSASLRESGAHADCPLP